MLYNKTNKKLLKRNYNHLHFQDGPNKANERRIKGLTFLNGKPKQYNFK